MHLLLTLILATSLSQAVDAAVKPLMAKHGIPGMAVGVIADGKPTYFFYGIASKRTGKPIDAQTIFEIGSISKTFTATLTSYASVRGFLSLSDPVDKYLPQLDGTQIGGATLVELGTHTASAFPLQIPPAVNSEAAFVQYLKSWHSDKAPGTVRAYTNVGIAALGLIAAKSLHEDFAATMDRRLFPGLGLSSTYIDVPAAKMAEYAEGYTEKGEPHRMTRDDLGLPAYAVCTTIPDLTRFLQINMGEVPIDDTMQRAVTDTHIGYFQAGVMTQDLAWEQYPYPTPLATILQGTGMDETAARRLTPPQTPQSNAWINKTGSTNGFAAYVAFVPAKNMGIVLLANKWYPLDDRVTAAFDILSTLTR